MTFEKSNPYLGSTHTQFFSCFIINSFITEANVVENSGSYQLQIRKKLNLFGGNAQNFVVAKHDFLHVSRGAYLPCTPVFHLFLYWIGRNLPVWAWINPTTIREKTRMFNVAHMCEILWDWIISLEACTFLVLRRRWSRNYLRPGAGAEIIFLINVYCRQFGGC